MVRVWPLLIAFCVVLGLSSCLYDPGFTPPPRLVLCTDDQVADGNVWGCKTLAAQGSASAMGHLGDYYRQREDFSTAYDWYRKAAELGDPSSLRRLYDDYRSGTKVPLNTGLATEYLNKAAGLHAQWAMLIVAKQSEATDPNGALNTYLTLARSNNCFAQARVALAYFKGDIAPRNVTQAYFWSLLAGVGADSRKSDYHPEADVFAKIAPRNLGFVFSCADVRSITPKAEAEAVLTADRRQMAQDAATRWQPNLPEPLLDGTPTPSNSVQNPSLPVADQPYPPPNPAMLHGHPAPDSVAIIIGIDQYENAPRASFAERDAAAFQAFAESSLGLSADNIRVLLGRNARRLDLERTLTSWIPSHIKPGKTTVLVFFAGHGLASDDGSDLFLLPYDGDRDLLGESALRRERLIERLKSAGAKQVTLLLDTCYSGISREGESLSADSRPIALTPKPTKVSDTVTILSAAQGTQLSLALKPAGHGLFSYMLLKGLEGAADANGDHRITAAELHAYVLGRVTQEAGRMGRKQTPVLDGDGSMVLVQW